MLDYIALIMLICVVLILFYGIIVIHDIPYEIAHKRNHPHQDAIHVAGWVSLLTLHVLWPFLWIWATLWREDRGWGFKEIEQDSKNLHKQVDELSEQVTQLQQQIAQLSAQANSQVRDHNVVQENVSQVMEDKPQAKESDAHVIDGGSPTSMSQQNNKEAN